MKLVYVENSDGFEIESWSRQITRERARKMVTTFQGWVQSGTLGMVHCTNENKNCTACHQDGEGRSMLDSYTPLTC
jgi:hypothetical protein